MVQQFKSFYKENPITIEIDDEGNIINFTIKNMSESYITIYAEKLEEYFSEQISQILKENEKDAREQEDHIRAMTDCGRYI